MTATSLEIRAVEGIPEVVEGDDLAALITEAGADLRDGDVVVVTSKVVSKSEGRLVRGSREEHLAAETVRVVARRGRTQIVQTRHGFVLAAAGIDASNVPAGTVALLPIDPDASARTIRAGLRERLGVDVAVIVTDTMGRPWRDGVVDTAIGAAGIEVLDDLRGSTDSYGQILEVTVTALADELAAAADLVKGKLEGRPVAVIRGFDVRRPKDEDLGARPLVRPAADDMFARGTHDAIEEVVRDSAPVEVDAGGAADLAAVRRAVASLGETRAVLTVAADAGSVVATGSALEVGYALGRLMAALAAEGLRASRPVETPDGARVDVTTR
ncbi:MAG TPA: coenzyme F420-0:L-glutamate ligase [Mycobacteriales bacterium]|nr:coenzyme F420-0:L-glutamate ligase [Mycobacteriales bacterium]HWB67473.1 coenzyme F420-0:L-glutamate ligase [Mycobacteriales bacterium]